MVVVVVVVVVVAAAAIVVAMVTVYDIYDIYEDLTQLLDCTLRGEKQAHTMTLIPTVAQADRSSALALPCLVVHIS